MISIDICGITENDNKHHEREFKGTLSSVKKWFQVGTYIDDICLYYFFWFSAPPFFLAILMNDHVAPWLLITAKIIWILIHALNC